MPGLMALMGEHPRKTLRDFSGLSMAPAASGPGRPVASRASYLGSRVPAGCREVPALKAQGHDPLTHVPALSGQVRTVM